MEATTARKPWPCSAVTPLGAAELCAKPPVQRRDNVSLLLIRELFTARNAVPFRQATAAAGAGGVLRDKHRMTPEGSLFPILGWRGGRDSAGYEILGVYEHAREAAALEVRALMRPKVKPLAKSRIPELAEHVVERTHTEL